MFQSDAFDCSDHVFRGEFKDSDCGLFDANRQRPTNVVLKGYNGRMRVELHPATQKL